jgi:hypothetical protein
MHHFPELSSQDLETVTGGFDWSVMGHKPKAAKSTGLDLTSILGASHAAPAGTGGGGNNGGSRPKLVGGGTGFAS